MILFIHGFGSSGHSFKADLILEDGGAHHFDEFASHLGVIGEFFKI
jgi:predicted esterase YcpF (UPF0227 family)